VMASAVHVLKEESTLSLSTLFAQVPAT
jgi:hypothetical protein